MVLEGGILNPPRKSLHTNTDFIVWFGEETDETRLNIKHSPSTSVDSGSTVSSASSCSGEGIGPNSDPNKYFINPNTGIVCKRGRSPENLSNSKQRPTQHGHKENGTIVPHRGSIQSNHVIRNRSKDCVYLTKYIEYMYFFGVSPYKTQRQREIESTDLLSRSLYFAQKVLFWIIAVLSTLHSLACAKHAYLCFMDGTGLYNFVDFCFYFVSFVTKTQAVYAFVFKSRSVDNMINSLGAYQSGNCSENEGGNKNQWLVTALGAVTISFAALKSILTTDISDWSLKTTIPDNAHEFALHALIWSSKGMSTKSDELEISYGSNITTTTVVFGMSSLAGDLASNLQMDTIRDVILIAAVTNYSIVSGFIKKVEETMENVENVEVGDTEELQRNREENWKKYRELKRMLEHTNDTFGTLLNIMHVDNLFLFAFFVTMCIEKENVSAFVYMMFAYNLTKSEITYYIVSKVAQKNDTLRKWIRNWSRSTGKIQVGKESWDIAVVLDELDKEPLGFGGGNFLIQESFHFKFLGMVGSLALFLADEKNNATN